MTSDMAAKNGTEFRFCRLCDIINGIPDDIGEYADKLYNLLDEKDRAGEELINLRLSVCEGCDRNEGGTCLACGCYCVVRSFAVSKHCPKKKW